MCRRNQLSFWRYSKEEDRGDLSTNPPDCPPLIEDLWKLFEGCWDPVPDSRPIIAAVAQNLKHIDPGTLPIATNLNSPYGSYWCVKRNNNDGDCVANAWGSPSPSTRRTGSLRGIHSLLLACSHLNGWKQDLTGRVIKTEDHYFAYGGFAGKYTGAHWPIMMVLTRA